jgi:hypothetical protein
MFRLVCCLGTELGIKIVAPIHDAVLVEAPLDQLSQHISLMQSVMTEASRQVLGGFEIRTEAKIITDRFSDPRGEPTWKLVRELLTRCLPPSKQFRLFEMEESGVPSPTSLH